MATRKATRTIDEYIAGFPPAVQKILRKIRQTIRRAAPGAEETISYQIPTFKLNGPVVHFAAFQNHIGLYPPVHGDEKLVKAVAPYANEKGNLRFPLDELMPYALIERIAKHQVRQAEARAATKSRSRTKGK